MNYLFLASFALIIYGTLFPFDFHADAGTGGILAAFVHSASLPPGPGDLLSNIVLFLPFGFFGVQALPARMSTLTRLVLVVALGVAGSLGIEIAQSFLAMRNTSVYDLGLNSLSVLIGALAGSVNWHRWIESGAVLGARPRSIFPLLMIAAWAAYRLFPYVPTIDVQQVKDALKPLLAMTPLPLADTVRHFGIVLALALLLQTVLPPARARLALVLLALGAIAAKPFIVTKVIWPAEFVAAIAALTVWFALLSQVASRTLIVTVIFAAALTFQGLSPFELRAEAAHFSFIPFSGFEWGSMAVNLQSFLEKVFLYGTLLWLIVQAGGSARLGLGLALVVTFTLAMEIAQRHIIGRSPEISDPILALLVGGALLLLERHYRLASGKGV
ncbi:MAG: VanZ family protein [Parahaliea sp.]